MIESKFQLKIVLLTKNYVLSLIITNDKKYLISGSCDETIKIWNIDGTLIDTLSGHTASIDNIALSPDGKLLASVSFDQTLRFWQRDYKKPFSFRWQKLSKHIKNLLLV